MTKSKFISDEMKDTWNLEKDNKLIKLEIAYQLKRIADELNELAKERKR